MKYLLAEVTISWAKKQKYANNQAVIKYKSGINYFTCALIMGALNKL